MPQYKKSLGYWKHWLIYGLIMQIICTPYSDEVICVDWMRDEVNVIIGVNVTIYLDNKVGP